jgi:Schlafen, AlbA_2
MVNFSNILFGKELHHIEVQDLELFFTSERDEDSKVEAKSYDSLTSNIKDGINLVLKSICAFLNSTGGIVVWGAPIETDGNFNGKLTPIPTEYTKDQLISKISDMITPLPVGIQVEILKYELGFVYLFQVQESLYKPHQCLKSYWVRLDGQSRTAPHYLIEALFKQTRFPNLKGFINLKEYKANSDGISILRIEILIFNFSELDIEEKLNCQLISDYGNFELIKSNDVKNGQSFQQGGEWKSTDCGSLHFGSPFILELALRFDLEELCDNRERTMKLLLIFGGKRSPLKTSSYTLNFNGSISRHNPVSLFYNIHENEFIHDKWKRDQFTEQTIINEFIIR